MQNISVGDIISWALFSILILISTICFIPLKILSYPVRWIRRSIA